MGLGLSRLKNTKFFRLFQSNQSQTTYSKSRTSGQEPGFFSSPVLHVQIPKWRANFVLVSIVIGYLALVGRSVYLVTVNNDFLQAEGEKRFERTLVVPASRGAIYSRNGEFLATSVAVKAIWAVPEEAKKANPNQLAMLAKYLAMPSKDLLSRLNGTDKTFVYLKRQVPIDVAKQIVALKISGVHTQSENRRSYPQGSVTAHLVGFTNIEDKGIDGIELAYNNVLAGSTGLKRVVRNRLGQVVEEAQDIKPAHNGKNLFLTIDTRIQYLASNALQKAITTHKAASGAAIVVDTRSGQILAMTSWPTYNPNEQKGRKGAALRNRAITDTFEPGSIIKPIVASLAIDAGAITPYQKFNTGRGTYQYQGATITDVSNHNGVLDVGGIIRRSSNIGMTMISERLRAEQMWTVFNALGFGHVPTLGFPGAASGRVRPWERWRLIEKATMAYGYGLSMSLLQVTQAYTALARNGDMISLSLVKNDQPPTSIQIYTPKTAKMMREMLRDAAGDTGTKIQQQVEGYSVGGKSGTARQIENGVYSRSKYRSSFVSIAPISNPRIVVAVTLDQPSVGGYYGSVVSGPVAAQIIEGTLKTLAVQPDMPVSEDKPKESGE